MSDNERVDPARTVWRWFLRQKAAWRAARVARCRAAADATILDTPPVAFDPQADVEIHSLTCQRDHLDLLWCVKTLRHYAGRPFDLVIHDDGSLTPQSTSALRSHLPGVRIVSREEADGLVADRLANRPAGRAFRDRLALARRIFDFPVVAKRSHYLVLDSDVLFFSRPEEMLRLIDRQVPFYMSDYQDGYIAPRDTVARRYGVDLMPAFNTGVSFFCKDMFDADFIERFCRDAEESGMLTHPWAEQTLFALLFSRRAGGAERLSPRHGISRAPIDADTVCHHFVNDGSRGAFYTLGIRRLRRAGFLRALAEKVA